MSHISNKMYAVRKNVLKLNSLLFIFLCRVEDNNKISLNYVSVYVSLVSSKKMQAWQRKIVMVHFSTNSL